MNNKVLPIKTPFAKSKIILTSINNTMNITKQGLYSML